MTRIHNPEPCSGTLFFDVNETLLDTTELNQVVAQRLGNRPERAEAWLPRCCIIHWSSQLPAAGTALVILPKRY